ncbi:MAG: N-6 DNA methylase [Candidatus Hermodarchaeota archaeon]
MGIPKTHEYIKKQEFLKKLEECLPKDILYEEISVPKEYTIESRSRNHFYFVFFKKDTIPSELDLKWQSGAAIALIKIKNSSISARRGLLHILTHNKYFKAPLILSTNYSELVTMSIKKDKSTYEVNEFSDLEPLVKHISNLITGKYVSELNRVDLNALLDLFQDIIIEISALFTNKALEELEQKEFLYLQKLDIEVIRTKEDREIYQDSLLFTSAYILLVQLLFHRTLQEKAPQLDLTPLKEINQLSDLKNHFNEVLEINYESIFALDIIKLLKSNSNTITLINLVLEIFKDFQIEDVRSDLLGFLLQRLMPFNYRKKIAAYYTKIKPAQFLANLAIDSAYQSIYDPACGPGGLLTASYRRKKALDPEINHQGILNEIYGSDISSLSCLLATINLSLQAPANLTAKCNIILSDVFELTHTKNSLDIVETRKKDTTAVVNGYKLPKVDVVIGNPPFTRGDRMSIDYKTYLTTKMHNLGITNQGIINQKHLGLHGYFLLDVKRHLKPKGTFAYILPYSVLYTASFEPVMNYVRKHFGIQYIIKSDVEAAFSDSAFEEIMLIGKRKYQGPIKVVILQKPLDEMGFEEIDQLANKITHIDVSKKQPDFRIMFLSQSELDDQKWTTFFYSEEYLKFWIKLKNATLPLQQFGETIRGNRVAPIDLYGLPNKNWDIKNITKTSVEVQNRISKTVMSFPLENLFRSMKRYNEMANHPAMLPPDTPHTFYVKFKPQSEVFKKWQQLNRPQLKKYQYPPIKRLTHLVIPQKIGLNTTRAIAFYSQTLLHVGDGFMSIMMDSEMSFWTFSFLTSSFGLFNILTIRRVISGLFCQILGPDMKYLRIPNFSEVSKSLKQEIRKYTEQIGSIPVKNRPTFLDALKKAKFDKNDSLYLLDVAFAKLMGLDTKLDLLYDVLIAELETGEDLTSKP